MTQLNLNSLNISGQEVFKMGLDDHKLVPLSEEDQKRVEEVNQTIFFLLNAQLIGICQNPNICITANILKVRGENSVMKTLRRTEPRSGVVHISIAITIIVNNIINSYSGSWVQLPTEKDPQHEGRIRL